ncbi:MAG: DUF2202 domain-containing protein [Eudoraea sp.]|uniref:DUF2202 domain-containing protein n=1 Tax=Eudoraea sp. TaxID=1979955 RepID=UPI003C785F47
MKYLKIINTVAMMIVLMFLLFSSACSNDDSETINSQTSIALSQIEKDALLFMMEEERLAKDVYDRLFAVWGINQFENIAKSEQSHMDAVENLLKQYNLPYTILDAGTFQNTDLQAAYDILVAQGEVNIIGALTSGATIEDLDIYDLEEWMTKIENAEVLNVFTKLQCGSRNHLRAFIGSLDLSGEIYTPKFITLTEYEQIINSENEKCN